MKQIIAAILVTFAASFAGAPASAQCNGQFAAGQFCGNPSGSQGLPTAISASPTIIATASGTNAITLTPVTPITSLADGMRFQFVATSTSTTAALVSIDITGVAGGPRSLLAGDAYTYMWANDIQAAQVVTIQYNAGRNIFVSIGPPQNWNQTRATHGTIVIGPSSFSPATGLTLNAWNGRGLIVKNPTTGAYRPVFGAGIANQQLFNNTAYVAGVANQSLADNTWYYVYVFNPSGFNVFDIAFDFYPNAPNAGPTQADIGIQIRTGDASRTFVGFLYTGNHDIGFIGSGVKPQKLVFSWFNPQLLQMRTDVITTSGVTSGSGWVDVPNAAIMEVVSASNFVPAYYAHATYTNTTAGMEGRIRLKLTGTQFNGDGTSGVINATVYEAPGTVFSAGKTVHLSTAYANALGDCIITVTPQVWVEGGTGSFDVWMISNAWQ